jgi:hypothetical protein
MCCMLPSRGLRTCRRLVRPAPRSANQRRFGQLSTNEKCAPTRSFTINTCVLQVIHVFCRSCMCCISNRSVIYLIHVLHVLQMCQISCTCDVQVMNLFHMTIKRLENLPSGGSTCPEICEQETIQSTICEREMIQSTNRDTRTRNTI